MSIFLLEKSQDVGKYVMQHDSLTVSSMIEAKMSVLCSAQFVESIKTKRSITFFTFDLHPQGAGKGLKAPKIDDGISSPHLTASFSAQMYSLVQIKEKKINGTNSVGGESYIDITVTKFTA